MTRILDLDLRSLALFRICLGALLLVDLLDRARDLTEFYSDVGVLPRFLLTSQYWNDVWWSLHLSSGFPVEVSLLFVVHIAFAAALVLGWQTRWSTFAAYLLTLSLHNRNPFVLDSADRLLLILLFWGNFLPWGEVWSLDSRRGQRLSPSYRINCLGGTGYLLQVCQVYLMAAVWKVHPVWITERTALFRTYELHQFTKPLGYWLAGFPEFLKWLTLATFVLEWIAPVLLLFSGNSRGRLVAIISLAILHIGIGLTMDLELFPLVSIVSLVGCLPSLVWERRASGTESGDLSTSLAWTTRAITGALASLAILGTLAWNLVMLSGSGVPPSGRLAQSWPIRLFSALRLVQFWDLFSPVPRVVDSRYFLEARLQDGRRIDLRREGRDFSFQQSSPAYLDFKNQHERNYLNSLEWSAGRAISMRYLRRQAVKWEEAHPDQKVILVRLWSLRTESSLLPGRQPTHEVEVAWAVSPKSDWRGPFPVSDPHARAVVLRAPLPESY